MRCRGTCDIILRLQLPISASLASVNPLGDPFSWKPNLWRYTPHAYIYIYTKRQIHLPYMAGTTLITQTETEYRHVNVVL